MTSPTYYRPRLCGLGALLLCCASLAQAQYMWIDAKGIKQYSDRPPPTSVPLKDIKKAPKGQLSADNLPAGDAAANAAGDAAPAASAPTPAAPAPKGQPTLADRNADFNKRQQDKAEQDKKERAESEQKSAQRENCERARAAKMSLDSGRRLGVTDKNGERGYMDDAQRAVEGKKVEKVLAGCTAG